MKRLLCVAFLALTYSVTASAALLSWQYVNGKIYQNTEQSPCIFQVPNCQGSLPAQDVPHSGNVEAFDTFALPGIVDYTGSQLNSIIAAGGGALLIGLDLNDTSVPQSLIRFDMYINGVLTDYLAVANVNIPLLSPNNGQGFADVLLSGFSQFGNNDIIRFRWVFGLATSPSSTCTPTCPANDGPDNAFIIGGPAIPEPSTWLLMSTGLFGLGLIGRKRSKRS